MKIATAATKRTELNLLLASVSASSSMFSVFEMNNNLRLRLRQPNEQQPNEQTQPQPQTQNAAATKRTALMCCLNSFYTKVTYAEFSRKKRCKSVTSSTVTKMKPGCP